MRTNRHLLTIVLLFLLSLVPSYLIVKRATKKGFSNSSQMSNNLPTATLKREPSVSGTFYPESSKEISAKIENFLERFTLIPSEGTLQILFVPHAGINYSGEVAGAGFKQIEEKKYSKVIILGASHREWFNHAAIYPNGIWETPLGEVKVSETLANKIKDDKLGIIFDPSPHKDEHSLEIELIFLQKVLKDFEIVPILVGQIDENLAASLAQKIASVLDDQTLLVVSTDLSHYPSFEIADEVDKKTIAGILSGKVEVFEQILQKNENAHYPGLDTCVCGENAVKVALRVAEILKITDFKLIKYQNSGDVTGNKSRVVGYGAIGAWNKNESVTSEPLDEKAQKEALKIAREALESIFSEKKDFSPPLSPSLQKKLGAFVTLRIGSELRGCIGTFEPKEPLYKVIQEMSIAAATNDPRFTPVSADELNEITIEISVMTPKQKITDWQQIEIGKHGVVVERGSRSGTFLPQVATETGWSLEEFLSQLCSQKAGLPRDCYKDPAVTLYIFEAQVFEER